MRKVIFPQPFWSYIFLCELAGLVLFHSYWFGRALYILDIDLFTVTHITKYTYVSYKKIIQNRVDYHSPVKTFKDHQILQSSFRPSKIGNLFWIKIQFVLPVNPTALLIWRSHFLHSKISPQSSSLLSAGWEGREFPPNNTSTCHHKPPSPQCILGAVWGLMF